MSQVEIYKAGPSIRELAQMGRQMGRKSTPPTPYIPPAEATPQPVSNKKAISVSAKKERVWTKSRLLALSFLIISAALAAFALRAGLVARDTGLLCLLSAVGSGTVLYGIPASRNMMRGTFSVLTAFFICLTSLILLPAFNLWPTGAGPLLFAMIFAMIGTMTRSRACLAAALIALFGLMLDSDGLTRMRLDAQIATLGLFSVGLFGGVIAKSRVIAAISTVAVMAATLTLLASFGVPAAAGLAILSVFAITASVALRAFVRQGYETAKIPMVLSCLMFVIAAIAFQLNLMGELGSGVISVSGAQSRTVAIVLLGFQTIVLFVSLVGWLSGRTSLMDVILTQAVLGLFCIVIVDPSRLARLDMGDPALVLAAFVGLVIGTLAAISLKRYWKDGRPVLTGLSALVLMIEIVLGLRILSGDFDIALAGLICTGVALSLAALMALNPRTETLAEPS